MIDLAAVRARARENGYLMMVGSMVASKLSRRFGIELTTEDLLDVVGMAVGALTIALPYLQHRVVAGMPPSAQPSALSATTPDDEIQQFQELLMRVRTRNSPIA
jgi:uncharacterized membrane protein